MVTENLFQLLLLTGTLSNVSFMLLSANGLSVCYWSYDVLYLTAIVLSASLALLLQDGGGSILAQSD